MAKPSMQAPSRTRHAGLWAEGHEQQLQELGRLMQAEGLGLQTARMRFDRLYALERLALAHASGGDRLRSVALALFALYELPYGAPRADELH